MLADIYDIKLAALERYIMLHIEKLEQARALQALEYERRLELLNGEAFRLRSIQETYLPRELYVSQVKEICQKLEELMEYKSTMEGKASQTSVFVAWGFSFISMVISLAILVANI